MSYFLILYATAHQWVKSGLPLITQFFINGSKERLADLDETQVVTKAGEVARSTQLVAPAVCGVMNYVFQASINGDDGLVSGQAERHQAPLPPQAARLARHATARPRR